MIIRVLLALFWLCSAAGAASLLPPGKQQFLGDNGAPLAGGSVYFYVPGTTTPKDTYQDAAGTILNTNPVGLDSGGFAVIYGSGTYREVVKDGSGNTIYDQLTSDASASSSTSWAGTTGGTANALTLTATGFSAESGQSISWKNSFTNTGATTVTVGGTTYGIVKDTLSGPVQLTGGELTTNDISTGLYDSTLGQFHLVTGPTVTPAGSLGSGAITDIGSVRSPNVVVTGSASITSFGSGAFVAQPLYFVTFTGNAVLTHNATSLIIPGGTNITTTNGSLAVVKYLGSGNWQVLAYLAGLGAGTEIVNAQVGTTYTVLAADQGKRVSFSNAAAIAVTVPQATGAFGSGFWFDVQNVGAGLATLTPTTSTINGAASLLLPPGYGLRVVSDGANWQIQGLSPLKGRVLLNTLTPSAVANVEDTTSLTLGFRSYQIEYENVSPATDNQPLELQIYTGASLRTANYKTVTAYIVGAGAVVIPTTYIALGIQTSNLGQGVSGLITVYTPSQTTKQKMWVGQFTGQDASTAGNGIIGTVGGFWSAGNDAVTGFRILFGAGNITSGTIRVYGQN